MRIATTIAARTIWKVMVPPVRRACPRRRREYETIIYKDGQVAQKQTPTAVSVGGGGEEVSAQTLFRMIRREREKVVSEETQVSSSRVEARALHELDQEFIQIACRAHIVVTAQQPGGVELAEVSDHALEERSLVFADGAELVCRAGAVFT